MSGITHVLAFDPGKATGWAGFEVAGQQYQGGEADFDGACNIAETWAQSLGTGLLIVTERFTITMQTVKNTQETWSLELIGVFRRAARKHTGRELVQQGPSDAKGFAYDARLKAMGFYRPGKGHQNDASRHLLLKLATSRMIPQDQLAALVG